MLKDDNSLRLKMGQDGRGAVGSRTIAYVVKDLLEWYGKGAGNMRSRNASEKLISLLIIVFSLPATIFIIFWYDIVVSCRCCGRCMS